MNDVFDLKNKTFLITGASSGIGKVIARIITENGGKVILLARNKQRLQDVMNQLNGTGNSYLVCDLKDLSAMGEQVNILPILNGVVHSAGILKYTPVKMINEKAYNEIFDINIKGVIMLNSLLLKQNKISNESSIIHIASIASKINTIGNALYASSKSALVAYSKGLALELARKKIRVNCISPGIVKTEMISDIVRVVSQQEFENQEKLYPLGYGKPEDVAYLVIYLLSDASRWVTGTNMIIDGGYLIQ